MFPPFDPERDDRKLKQRVFARGQVPTRVLIPNIFTLLGLCAGLTAIRMAIEHRWDLAVAALVFAAFLDGIDGRIARLLKASSRFGAELDSLADFVNFGVAPAIIIFNWALDDLRSMGWIVVLIYAVCAALRLARFNVALERSDLPAWKNSYFVGVPAPSGEMIGQKIAREHVLPVFVFAALFIACLLTYPSLTLAVGSVIYLALIPLSAYRYFQEERKVELIARAQNGKGEKEPAALEPPSFPR
jgi:CDP-diacylglycerol---serine O-phosphatidyltransferase